MIQFSQDMQEIFSLISFYKFDVKLQDRWNAAVDADCFAYKLDDIETRIVPGKYQVFLQVKKQHPVPLIRKLVGYEVTFIVVANFSNLQLNEMRFNKRRQPQRMSSVSQPFNPDNFNFTKVQSKEVSTG